LLSAAYGRDFTRENDLLPALGFDTTTREALEALARNGF